MYTTSLAICGAIGLLILAASALAAETKPGVVPLDAQRVKAISAMLPEAPSGLGRPIIDRAAWDRLAASGAYARVVAEAAKLLDQPVPDQPDELYLDYSKTGNRTRWQRVAFPRRGRLVTLTLAECAENKGRFIPLIARYIEAYCAEKTWVMPAHDAALRNFNGQTVEIDLASSALSWNLALVDWLLGQRMPEPTRRLLRENLQRRTLEPFGAMFRGQRPPMWWMLGTNNWNAVCLAGVTGTALAQIADRGERAEFVAAAELYSRNFLAGFTGDGYCSEGLGYWNYGFGHYVLLAESIWQATGGRLDLMSLPQVRAPATFGAGIQIIGGVAPAFADCAVDAAPSSAVMFYVNRRFGLGLQEYDSLEAGSVRGSLFEELIYRFPNSASAAEPAPAQKGPGLRTWFEEAGVLIGRPAPASRCRMGVALKGGHNAEHHNHNDLGSYVVVVGNRPVLLDPGAETYTARTFGPQRYEGRLLNSFGHPVPVVAGQLQRTGREAQAKVLATRFTDDADTMELDISSAYAVPQLRALVRRFVYSREGGGSLTVTDRVQFTEPRSFGTALITLGTWTRQDDGSLLVRDGDQAVRVRVQAEGGEVTFEAEEIREDAPVRPTRIGINFARPVSSATLTLTITPP